jgi:uncharacterized protein (TIGR03067 family)
MTTALLALAAAFCLATATGAREKQDAKDDKAAKLAKAIDEIARAAESLGVKPLTKGQKKAAEPLQGTWTVVKAVDRGKPVPEAELKKLTVTIKGQVVVFAVDGEAKPGPAFLKHIDATKAPKELDLDVIVDDHARPLVCGIYEADGQTLTVALGGEDATTVDEVRTKRPTSFKAAGVEKGFLVVLKKAK